jgi:hypothetical protein
MATQATAQAFLARLEALGSPVEQDKLRCSFQAGEGGDRTADVFLGVRMADVFALVKEFVDLPPDEIDQLLASPIHEARAGGLSIMGKQATRKRTPERRRKELYELYLRHTDRIDNWDLVDVSAPYVVGGYLFDKPRDVLFELARSESVWERRTAIISTGYFIRQGDVADTFRIAELLLGDGHDLIHKATGWMLREAGKRDRQRLLGFLDRHAAVMPRTALRYAIEHLDKEQRAHYLGMKQGR